MTVTDRLMDAMRRDPRTLAELSAATGVDGAILSRVRRGESTPRLDTAERIAAGLGYRLELTKPRPARRASKGRA